MPADDVFKKKTRRFRLGMNLLLCLPVHWTEQRGITIEIIETPRWLRNGRHIQPHQMCTETLGEPSRQHNPILNPRVCIKHHQHILVTHALLSDRQSARDPIAGMLGHCQDRCLDPRQWC